MSDPFADEAADLADDVRELFLEIEPGLPADAAPAHCRPPLDVIETAAAIELVMDLPGVTPAAVRVALRRDTLLIVGRKSGPAGEGRARYHVAERSYGRFVRAVHLDGAFDGRGAHAMLTRGQLRIVLPFIEDRRGRPVSIPVERS